MALIDPDDAAARTGEVIQNRLGHFEAHAELLQTGGAGSSEVMQHPALDPARVVQADLEAADTLEGSAVLADENARTGVQARLRGDDRLRLARQWHNVGDMVLRPG